MHLYVRLHHWVIWWLCVGAVLGLIAIVNILTADFTRTQDGVILVIGILFWTLGGFIYQAYEGVEFKTSPRQWHPINRLNSEETMSPRIVEHNGDKILDLEAAGKLVVNDFENLGSTFRRLLKEHGKFPGPQRCCTANGSAQSPHYE